MPKSRASFVKRQREIAKKEQRQAKLQRKLDRRAAAGASPASTEPDLASPAGDGEPGDLPEDLPEDLPAPTSATDGG